MRNYKYLILGLIAFTFLSCEDTDIENEGFRFEYLPSYVAFNGDGSGIVLDTVDVSEGDVARDNDPDTDDGDLDAISIENTTGTLSDIVVDFTFSGTAVFGTDFTISNTTNTTAEGGTIVIPDDESDVNQFNNINFEITYLNDAVVDEEKILTITLTNAVNLDGEVFAIGRGGTELLRSHTIRIADVD